MYSSYFHFNLIFFMRTYERILHHMLQAKEWLPPKKYPPAKVVSVTSPSRSNVSSIYEMYTMGFGGPCSIFDPPCSFWCKGNDQRSAKHDQFCVFQLNLFFYIYYIYLFLSSIVFFGGPDTKNIILMCLGFRVCMKALS